MNSVNTIGTAFLRAILLRMKELGLNKTALAQRMNVSRAYISKVFKGDVNFTFASACHFAQALGMDLSFELKRQRKAKPKKSPAPEPLPANVLPA